jgi:hypothetical protein
LRQKLKPSGFNASLEARRAAQAKLKGRTFLSRGGNGQITVPQGILHVVTGFPMEYAIETSSVKDRFKSLPPAYKVDLAVPELKLAIEVDGNSHKAKLWRFLDHRKTEVLKALGWYVLRFWNQEVLTDLGSVCTKIMSTTLQLKERITTMPMVY